ncbi:MAG: hypothetical protein KAS17_07065, partial [Victivallaceae bacterium]|nr:hypothetical protein [Victivallaceae bacterium]
MKKVNFFVILFFSMCLYVQAQEAAKDPIVSAGAEEVQPAVVVIPDDAKPASEYVREAWELNGQGKLQELGDLTKEALEIYGPKAKELQAPLAGFPSTAQQKDYQILNDVGTILFIQAEAFMNYGRTEEAIAAFQDLIE